MILRFSPPFRITKLSIPCYYRHGRRHYCNSDREVQTLRSPDLVALEYADLNLSHRVYEAVGHVRIRQHVNPLSYSFSTPVQAPDWKQVFRDPTLPLMVDIGSGSGRFLLWLAKRNPDSRNYLGLEIRKKVWEQTPWITSNTHRILLIELMYNDLVLSSSWTLTNINTVCSSSNTLILMQLVERAKIWVKELDLSNIHFIVANATVSFKQLISTYPGSLMLVSILCPDPHFKKRHHKRRVVQKSLVDSIVDSLMPGGEVFIQSDVLEVALDMRNQFDAESDALQHIDALDPNVTCDSEGWLLSNLMGIRTEREIHAEFEGAKIYRRMYRKHR